jgi:flagellar hook protein FlgE
MSLASVLQTAYSGMSAASMMVCAASNNLANSCTPGYKASRPSFATQTPQTLSAGSTAGSSGGGTNPVQVGTGVRAVGVATDFSQGSMIISSNPLHVALQGNGFFIVEGPAGERSYTRAGQFQLNADGEIVTSTGQRLQGYGVDGQFQIDDELTTLSIPLNSTARSADGSVATLTSYAISEDGRIEGRYSDGVARDLGQIRVANFANPSGLEAGGNTLWRAGVNSGQPVEASPGTGAVASVTAGAIELSNTDVGENLVDLILATHQLTASADVFRTADHLLDELSHVSRNNG